jgi:hypothetical protein
MRTESKASTAYTISPAGQTEIEMQVQPNAVCSLHARGDDDPDHRIKAFADSQGFVRFHVGTEHPTVATDDAETLVVDAEVGGRTARHEVAFRAADKPTADFPSAPKPRASTDIPGAVEYPGLEEAKALDITAEEVSVLGLPPRPDRREDPQKFDDWIRTATRPTVFVPPDLRNNPDVSHLRVGKRRLVDLDFKALPPELFTPVVAKPQNSNNWCGYERLRRHHLVFRNGNIVPVWDAAFTSVHGRWTVPTAYPPLGDSGYSSTWVGIDGDGTTDLVQAGTEHDSVKIGLYYTTVYRAWTEFLPQQPTEKVVANFAIAPGDDVRVTVDMQLADGNPSRTGNAAFIINNLTKGVWTVVNTPRGTTRVGGSEAVWITERPTVGGSLPDLANFGTVTMTEALAGREDHTDFWPYLGTSPSFDNTINTMVNGSDVLATVTALDSQSMRFNWQRFF